MVIAASFLSRLEGGVAEGAERELGPQSDESLVALVAARDGAAHAALTILYARYSGAVYGLGRRMLGDSGQAEHIVQETFWRLWQHAGRYEPGRVRLGTWLLRVARNLAIGELRAAACRPKLVSHRVVPAAPDEMGEGETPVEPGDVAEDVPELAWQAERRRLIRRALLTLPPEQRQAVELAYFGGLTHRQIAAVQAAPPSTVKTRLALGLRKLACQLRADGLRADAY